MKHLFLILLCVAALAGCNLDKNTDDDNTTIIDIGHFTLDDNTLTNFAYQNDSTYVYIDSLGRRLNLFLEKGAFTSAIEKEIVSNNGDEIRYTFTNEVQHYTLKNDSFFIKMFLEISARPFAQDPQSLTVADVLNVFVENTLGQRELVFYRELNIRSWPVSYQSPRIDQLDIFGKNFNALYKTQEEDPLYTIWYSDRQGIVSFIDFLGDQFCIL